MTQAGPRPMLLRDRTLAHQNNLSWTTVDKIRHVHMVCNCPWRGQPRLPQDPNALTEMLDEYRQHCADSKAS